MKLSTFVVFACLSTLVAGFSCSGGSSSNSSGTTGSTGGSGSGDSGSGGSGGGGGGSTPSTPGVVTSGDIAAWDALSQSEKNSIQSWNSLFLHQSVGQDLEDGCEANGFSFEYFNLGNSIPASPTHLYGGLFASSNGNPTEKFSEFRTNALANASNLRVAIFKFGYADIEPSTLSSVEAGYLSMVNDLKSSGIRVLHITPPLVYDTAYNQAKMDMRTWMFATFPSDVIFDLQDIESKTGATGSRCEVGGIWRICPDIRSTDSCLSRGQGSDSGDAGRGHLCASAADIISKAFLYSIYRAGR